MVLAALVLFLLTAAAITYLWNRFFDPVPLRVAGLFVAIVATYQGPTLFTQRVDLAGHLAFAAYPWKVARGPVTTANTGIVMTQIAPWTRVAVGAIKAGEWPLWNRYSGSGTPLLANQQTAMFHPFTLIGFLVLSAGKAFTFTACARLFALLFFTFTMARGAGLKQTAAIFAAVAYTFCTFHIVWLLFPLGLATMMLPVAMTGVQQLDGAPRRASFFLLTTGLALCVLGGHPESAFWVWFVTAAYAVFRAYRAPRRLALALLAFATAAALTAFWWYPTVELLPEIGRLHQMGSATTNPTDHGLGREWLYAVLAPNVMGTPQAGTWTGPDTHHPAVLEDYGEIASGYAGVISIVLALGCIFSVRRREAWFFLGAAIFALLTIGEIPLWRDILRIVPVAGLTILQRLRFLFALGVCMAAAFALDGGLSRRATAAAVLISAACITIIYVDRSPSVICAWQTLLVSLTCVAVFIATGARPVIAAVLTFLELGFVTWGYNPSARPHDALPRTPAIDFLASVPRPSRSIALGWSLLPDTPAFYGIEDVKTTDPIRKTFYINLMMGFLHAQPTYDQVIGTVDSAFFDMLNIKHIYVPPDVALRSGRTMKAVYAGTDGTVYENPAALPRYFFVRRFTTRTDQIEIVRTINSIYDMRSDAVIDHVPRKITAANGRLRDTREWIDVAPSRATLLAYSNNATTLDVESTNWSLLVSSDVHWPGWCAYVDGERQPPITANGAFLALFVPPGKHRVRFVYRPPGFERGLRISGAALLLCLLTSRAIRVRAKS